MSINSRFGLMLAAVAFAFLVAMVGMHAPDRWQLVRYLLLTAAIATGLFTCAALFSVHESMERLARDIRHSHQDMAAAQSHQIDNMLLQINRRHTNMLADMVKIVRPRVDEVLRDVAAANRAARTGENNNGL